MEYSELIDHIAKKQPDRGQKSASTQLPLRRKHTFSRYASKAEDNPLILSIDY